MVLVEELFATHVLLKAITLRHGAQPFFTDRQAHWCNVVQQPLQHSSIQNCYLSPCVHLEDFFIFIPFADVMLARFPLCCL